MLGFIIDSFDSLLLKNLKMNRKNIPIRDITSNIKIIIEFKLDFIFWQLLADF